MNKTTLKSWIESIPKIELHLHLEGAIPLLSLWELIQKYGGNKEVKSLEDLESRFLYKNFNHFIQTWVWKNTFLREYEDFTFIASKVAEDLRAQNILYAETFISPPDFHRFGLTTQKIIEAVYKGLSKVSGIKINLVVDLVRDYGAQKAMQTIHEIEEVKNCGIIGIGIGGSEVSYPPSLFKETYSYAKKIGLKTSAHAGEAAGSESIKSALFDLEVDRIGHGTRIYEDIILVEHVIKNKIGIELCPLSNLRTKVISSMSEHPAKKLFQNGALISINTDDPKMFNNSLVEEFEILFEQQIFSKNEIQQILFRSIESSWMTKDEKDKMHLHFKEHFKTCLASS